ncbi:hypothetical protein [Fischerella sp. PCC 9605]|uniref:hypothetical protein n=1 Tax=Fischerella sp. PCC 9605 TaxID=1173024 RepID=UPI000479F47E|nr:hypothetical protein [Fischerella sp. PCC 9605]
MKLLKVLLVTLLFLTPATALAQPEKQSTYDKTVTTGSKLDQERRLRLRIKQQTHKSNTDIVRVLRKTRQLKRFSRPYIVEFQRRIEQMQHRPDVPRLRKH